MKSFNVIAGLPRAGSTLLANILSQNPKIYASGTSALPSAVLGVSQVITNSPEVTAELANVSGSYERYRAAMRGIVEGWYSDRKEPIVFDKSRGWTQQIVLLRELYPKSVMLVCVRDPRSVVASVELQHRKTGLFGSQAGATIHESSERMMQKDGLIGSCINGVEDLLRRDLDNVVYIKYETFVKNPDRVMKEIYEVLGADAYKHDFKKVKNVSTDLDPLYRNKFPHKGEGEVKDGSTSWKEVVDPDLAVKIASVYPFYMNTFGYSKQ